MTVLYTLALVIVGIVSSAFLWLKHRQNYWKRNNVPYIPGSLIWGNMKQTILLNENVATSFNKFYSDEKTKDEPYVGIFSFHKPMLLIKDPELIKTILVKDFNVFSDRHSASDPHSETLSYYMLFFLRNPLWKDIRTRLTPVFTSGKIKQMFYLMNNIGCELNSYMQTLSHQTKSFSGDMKDLCGKYTTDVIASCAFGVQANSINDPNSEFRLYGKQLANFTWWRGFEFNSFFFLPEIVRICGFKFFTENVSRMIRSSITDKMAERERSGITRNDFIDILITLKNEDKDKVGKNNISIFKGDLLFAQAAVFYMGGLEPSSATMSFALYELAMQPQIQKRLRQDIKDVLKSNNDELSFDIVQNMDYLDMVVKETLRLYPVLPFLDRKSVFPKGQKSYSLRPFGDYKMPHDMPVMIPVYALHTDPKYFPNPFKFDPERFSTENRDSINPYTYMPFGRGPRNCIGDRFGIMQSKVGIIYVLKNHFVTPGDNTIKEMRLEKKALLLQAEGGINLNSVYDPLF